MAVVNGVTVPDIDLAAVARARNVATREADYDRAVVVDVLRDLLTQYDNLAGRVAILAAGVEG